MLLPVLERRGDRRLAVRRGRRLVEDLAELELLHQGALVAAAEELLVDLEVRLRDVLEGHRVLGREVGGAGEEGAHDLRRLRDRVLGREALLELVLVDLDEDLVARAGEHLGAVVELVRGGRDGLVLERVAQAGALADEPGVDLADRGDRVRLVHVAAGLLDDRLHPVGILERRPHRELVTERLAPLPVALVDEAAVRLQVVVERVAGLVRGDLPRRRHLEHLDLGLAREPVGHHAEEQPARGRAEERVEADERVRVHHHLAVLAPRDRPARPALHRVRDVVHRLERGGLADLQIARVPLLQTLGVEDHGARRVADHAVGGEARLLRVREVARRVRVRRRPRVVRELDVLAGLGVGLVDDPLLLDLHPRPLEADGLALGVEGEVRLRQVLEVVRASERVVVVRGDDHVVLAHRRGPARDVRRGRGLAGEQVLRADGALEGVRLLRGEEIRPGDDRVLRLHLVRRRRGLGERDQPGVDLEGHRGSPRLRIRGQKM